MLDPKPLLRAYLGSLPIAYRRPGMRAYRRACRAVIGWTKASLVIGAIQSVAVFVFLSLMDVPGALVWAALAFFADFIPRIGGYVMALPPVVLSLTMGPMTAIWVGLFYLVSTEILGSVVAPKIRGATMQLHPVLLIFFTLAFALAFGLLGAIVATPAAAFFSAYYSEFYLKRPLRRDGADLTMRPSLLLLSLLLPACATIRRRRRPRRGKAGGAMSRRSPPTTWRDASAAATAIAAPPIMSRPLRRIWARAGRRGRRLFPDRARWRSGAILADRHARAALVGRRRGAPLAHPRGHLLPRLRRAAAGAGRRAARLHRLRPASARGRP